MEGKTFDKVNVPLGGDIGSAPDIESVIPRNPLKEAVKKAKTALAEKVIVEDRTKDSPTTISPVNDTLRVDSNVRFDQSDFFPPAPVHTQKDFIPPSSPTKPTTLVQT